MESDFEPFFHFCFADKTVYNRQLTEERPLEEQVDLSLRPLVHVLI